MNREQLIEKGLEIEKISELSDLCEKYEDWKVEVLRYAENHGSGLEQYRVLLYVVDIPYESKEEKLRKYHLCIKKTLHFTCQPADM